MAINLEAARRKIEAEMVDDLRIVRRGRLSGGVFNRDTLQYEYDPEHDTTIYEGKGIVSASGQEARPRPEGGETAGYVLFNIRIPISAPEILENDVVIVDASQRDPEMTGKEFIVDTVLYTTFAVSRRMFANQIVRELEP